MDESFGKYELLEQIGIGGMAEVFLAKSFGAEGIEKILVIKRILPEYTENPKFVDMFVSEAKIAMDLNHPNVVQIYDFGKVENQFYLAMEFIDGIDLGIFIAGHQKLKKKISIGNAVYIISEIAKGLHYAHERKDSFGEPLKIVHRDISPQNILISPDGGVKLVDFGIAKATSVTDENPNVVRGKFSYMSPEQASGRYVDHRSDIFSLGTILFELLCNRPLFKHANQKETMSLVKSAVVPDLLDLNPDLPLDLVDLVYKSLAKNPDERFSSARDIQVALTRILYRLEDIHDATTVGNAVNEVEKSANISTRRKTNSITHTTLSPRPKSETKPGTTLSPSTPITRFVDSAPTELHTRERKEVVIVAGELMGLLDLRNVTDQMRWLQTLQEFSRIIDSIAYKNSAVVHRVNESGFVILFGIPVSSENDCELAVRVSMDLHEAVLGMNPSLESPVHLSAGIAIGNVSLEQEITPSGRRFSWSFLGTDYELAERLARRGLAKEILVGGQVFRRIRRRFDCEKIDYIEVPVDGEECKIQAYLVQGMKSVQTKLEELRHAYGSFYGRDIHLKNLRDVYRTVVVNAVPTAFVVLGGEGVGKSTLVEHFLGGLDDKNVRIVRGGVPTYQRDVPFGAIATFLGHTLRLGDTGDLRAIQKTAAIRINALFSEESLEEREFLIESIAALFSIQVRDKLSKLSAGERRSRIFLSLQKILERFSEKRTLVIWMDDAHNIDTLSLEFIISHFNADHVGTALLILCANSNNHAMENCGWRNMLNKPSVRVDELPELIDSNAKSLVDDLLRFYRIEDDFLSREILKRSGNNPLYIKEVVELLRDRGMLKDTGQRRQIKVDRNSPHWLPSSVEGLINARIDRLPLHLKVVLQKVAFLWNPFTLADLILVLPDTPYDEIEALVTMRLLVRNDAPLNFTRQTFNPEETPEEKRQYRFCNALTQNVAAAGIIPEEAAIMHQTLAAYLAKSESKNSKYNALIASHYEAAGNDEQAVVFYAEAAKDAFENSGAAESLRLCKKILERVDENSPHHFETLRTRAKALAVLGRKLECEEALKLLLAASEKQELVAKIETLLFQAHFHYDHSELKRAKESANTALKLATEIDNLNFKTKAILLKANILVTEGNAKACLELVSKVINELESESDESSDPSEATIENLAEAYNITGIIHTQTGNFRDALAAYETGQLLADKISKQSLSRRFSHNIGLTYAYLGDFGKALERYEKALVQIRRLGYRRDESKILANIGHTYFLRGEYDKAIPALRRGIYLARKTTANHQLADGLITIGEIYLAQNDLKKSESALHEGLRIADSIPNVYLSIHATFLLAQLQLKSSTPDAARIAFIQAEDGCERAEQADIHWGICYGAMLMARAYKARGERQKAIEFSQKAYRLLHASEIFSKEEILYYHVAILPDDEEFAELRKDCIQQAKEIVMDRHDRIEDPKVRHSYLSKDLNRKILNVASLLK